MGLKAELACLAGAGALIAGGNAEEVKSPRPPAALVTLAREAIKHADLRIDTPDPRKFIIARVEPSGVSPFAVIHSRRLRGGLPDPEAIDEVDVDLVSPSAVTQKLDFTQLRPGGPWRAFSLTVETPDAEQITEVVDDYSTKTYTLSLGANGNVNESNLYASRNPVVASVIFEELVTQAHRLYEDKFSRKD